MHLTQAILCRRDEQGRSIKNTCICYIQWIDTPLCNNCGGKKNQLPSLLLDKNADWLAVRIRISCKTHPSISEFEIIFLLNLKKTLLGPFRPFCIFFGKVLFSLCWFQLLVSIGCSGQRERSWWCFGRACWKPWTPVFCTAQLKVKICC